jgi:hypothetical protein
MAVLGTVICIPYLALAKGFFNHHELPGGEELSKRTP